MPLIPSDALATRTLIRSRCHFSQRLHQAIARAYTSVLPIQQLDATMHPLFGCSLHPRPNRTGCLLSRDPEASGNFPEKSWGCQNGCHPLNKWCSLHEILWAVAPKPVTPPGVAMRVAEFETQMERAPLAVCLCLLRHTHASQPLSWLLKKKNALFFAAEPKHKENPTKRQTEKLKTTRTTICRPET